MKKFIRTSRFMFVSPWLIAASIALTTLIIVIFAANNMRREVDLINNGLFLRGQALARFVGAGTRASMMQGFEGATHTQRLIEQVSHDPNILYIAVIDSQNQVVAHSNPAMVDQLIERDYEDFNDSSGVEAWHIVKDNSNRNIFEVVSEFSPFRIRQQFNNRGNVNRSGPGHKGDNETLFQHQYGRTPPTPEQAGQGDWCRNMVNGQSECKSVEYRILVGLDMTTQEGVTKQAKIHILLMSGIMFFVGLGGWLYLFVAQSYQASQKTLKHIQAFTNLLILKLPVGIIATDQDGTIKTYNKAMADMIGVADERVVGNKPEASLPGFIVDLFSGLQANEEIFEKEIVLQREKSRSLTLHVSSLPIVDHESRAVGRVLMAHDLTELKQLEKEVTKHDRLVALGKMAAGVAHEVRNPLSSIKGFATMLGASFAEGSEEHNASRLLVNEVARLNRSITEMLNYARPLPLEQEEVDVQQLVDDSLQLMTTDAAELGIDLSLVLGEKLPHVWVDVDRIKQVLLNLFLNAIQAMEAGGKLTVTCDLTAKEDFVEVAVTDTGCGISNDQIEHIQDPYFTTKPDGTGLGLALVYKIIDEHGGSIHFTSEVEKGTMVTILLPTFKPVD